MLSVVLVAASMLWLAVVVFAWALCVAVRRIDDGIAAGRGGADTLMGQWPSPSLDQHSRTTIY